MAADWILKLFSLAKGDQGVDKIHFFNVISDASLLGTSRVHPLSDLLVENFNFTKEHSKYDLKLFPFKDKKVLGLWLSSDGDDTGAKYKVTIKNINLITE